MKIPTTPVILASLTFASSSLAAPTAKQPGCDSPSLGERSPLLGQDSWEPALQLKGKGVGGQGRPWGARKRDEEAATTSSPSIPPAPSSTDSPALNAETIPLLDGLGGGVVPGLGVTAANGPLAPVTGLVGSAPGAVKGVLGSTTGTVNGLLGGTPVGGLVSGVGNVGTGLAGGFLDSVGGGGLGLGQILKPVTGTVGGLLNGLPIVGPIAGPIAGSLTGTLSGLNIDQQVNGLNVPSDPAMAQYPGPGMGSQAQAQGQQMLAQAQTQGVQEKVVGNLGGGQYLTNTGRIVSLLPPGAGGAVPAGLANGVPQLPSGLANGPPVQLPAGLGGLGQALQPVTSSPLTQAPLAGLPLGQGANPLGLNLGNIVSNLPPGLSQIVQPVGSADKFLQIGTQLIPLGAMDPTQLAQLGLDKLPISAVNNLPGMASINYLQNTQDQSEEESKEVQANPVTSWMNGDGSMNNGSSTMPAESTPTDPIAPAPSGTGDGTDTQATSTPMARRNIQPMYVAPTTSQNSGQQGLPQGLTQWSEINLKEGETFDRIADGMSGREHSYYNGSEKNNTMIPDMSNHNGTQTNGTTVEDGPAPDFHANKGRLGWQLISDVLDPEPSTTSTSTSGWHKVSASATAGPTASGTTTSAYSSGPTPTPSDAGTYAWNEDWGDWVQAGMDDMGLDLGWDESTHYEDPTHSAGGAGGSGMYPQPSAGLS